MIQSVFRPRSKIDRVARFDETDPRNAAVKRWLELFEISEDRADYSMDPEDFLENTAYLFAAIDKKIPVFVLSDDRRDSKIIKAIGATEPDSSAPFIHMGFHSVMDDMDSPETWKKLGLGQMLMPDRVSEKHAVDYYKNQTFAKYAGRPIAPACIANGDEIPLSDPTDLRKVVLDVFARTGKDEAEIFIKFSKPAKKYPPISISVDRNSTEKEVQAKVMDILEYSAIPLGGVRNNILVQEKVEMRDEYRVVVIGGRPVSGAGCVEAFTPWDRTPQSFVFDSQMESSRSVSPVRNDTKAADAYRVAAGIITKEISAENPELRNYTLDLYRDKNGNVGIVELNQAENFGLYANNPARIVHAFQREAQFILEKTEQVVEPKAKKDIQR